MAASRTRLSLTENNMTPDEMYKQALEARSTDSRMSMTMKKGTKRPAGFPRGELMCEQPEGNVYSFDSRKIIKWLNENNLINQPTEEKTMENEIFKDIVDYAINKLNGEYGYCGAATAPGMAILNSTDKDGNDITIKINFTEDKEEN